MSQSLWPEGKKSAAMFTFDLDGDIIWQNMSSDEPNTEKLIRARSIGQYGPNPLRGHDSGIYWTSIR